MSPRAATRPRHGSPLPTVAGPSVRCLGPERRTVLCTGILFIHSFIQSPRDTRRTRLRYRRLSDGSAPLARPYRIHSHRRSSITHGSPCAVSKCSALEPRTPARGLVRGAALRGTPRSPGLPPSSAIALSITARSPSRSACSGASSHMSTIRAKATHAHTRTRRWCRVSRQDDAADSPLARLGASTPSHDPPE
jgi:hypothetical protein